MRQVCAAVMPCQFGIVSPKSPVILALMRLVHRQQQGTRRSLA